MSTSAFVRFRSRSFLLQCTLFRRAEALALVSPPYSCLFSQLFVANGYERRIGAFPADKLRAECPSPSTRPTNAKVRHRDEREGRDALWTRSSIDARVLRGRKNWSRRTQERATRSKRADGDLKRSRCLVLKRMEVSQRSRRARRKPAYAP